MGAADRAAGLAFHQLLGGIAVVDQIADGANLDAVLMAEIDQLRQACHGAIVIHDLADHRRRLQSAEAGQIAAGLGVAGAHQHAAILGHQREDVARLHQVGRGGVAGHGGLHGARSIGGGDARGHPLGRLDRHGEGGTVGGAVVAHHQRQVELFAALAGQGQADQATAVLGHEVDRFGRDMVGGQNQVAFVLAVFLVDEDDHLADAHVGNDLVNGADVAHGGRCRRMGKSRAFYAALRLGP